MREFVVAEKVYGRGIQRKLELLGWEMLGRLEGLEVDKLDLKIVKRGWVKVSIEGEDEAVASSILKRAYGEVPSMEEVREGTVLRGFAVDVGKVGYGLYVDAFLEDKDALFPLYEMRRLLSRGRKLPARMLMRLYGIVENRPIQVLIKKVQRGEVEVTLSDDQISEFRRWLRRKLDVLVVTGATDREVRRALIRTDHLRDVIKIERLAFLAHALVCKSDTDAKGLIPEVGPHLPGSKLGVFSPKVIMRSIG